MNRDPHALPATASTDAARAAALTADQAALRPALQPAPELASRPASHPALQPASPIRRLLLAGGLGLLATACLPRMARAANGQVIRFVVPFAAGSYTDNVARIIAPAMASRLNASIIIDNRPGANGIIGADWVAKAKPDGLTLLVGGASVNTIDPAVYKKLPYDPVNDLLPVTRFGQLPFLLLINPDVPAHTVPQLIAYAKQNPGKLSYGTPNSSTLVGMETFKRNAGVDILSVPYKSSQQVTLDLVSGRIQVLIADFATGMPMVTANKVRLIAVTMARRSALLPNVPAIGETLPHFDLTAWTGLLAPAHTAPDTIKKLDAAARGALADSQVQSQLKTIGYEIKPLGPEQFGPYLREDIASWGKAARDAGIEPQ